MRRVLEDEDYQVSILQDGKDAFTSVKRTLPDLGEVSGQDILKQIKGDELTTDVPIIIYTAAILEAEEVSKSIREEPQYYSGVHLLQKPFELEALLTTVEQLLDKAAR